VRPEVPPGPQLRARPGPGFGGRPRLDMAQQPQSYTRTCSCGLCSSCEEDFTSFCAQGGRPAASHLAPKRQRGAGWARGGRPVWPRVGKAGRAGPGRIRGLRYGGPGQVLPWRCGKRQQIPSHRIPSHRIPSHRVPNLAIRYCATWRDRPRTNPTGRAARHGPPSESAYPGRVEVTCLGAAGARAALRAAPARAAGQGRWRPCPGWMPETTSRGP
jgi:hypothetical protein